ncbi:MAG: peptide ABC transporter substrate-binding protein [Alphaproteobacteria bacterium]
MTLLRSNAAGRVLSASALSLALVVGASVASAEVVFHRGNTGEPETLDPHRTSTTYESNILHDLLEGLVIHDPAANVVPGVAESWEISEDGKIYTFHLRGNAKWSNGDPVTAGDFVFSLRRILTPDTGAKYSNILYPIKSAEAINNGEASPEDLGVVAIDDTTLQIELESATPYFLELLTHQTGLPVHPPSVEAWGDDFVRPENMVTNGAYILDEVVPQAHVKAVRNENYWENDSVQVDTIFYYATEDRAAALRRFQAGELHTNNDVPQDQVRWMKENLAEEFKASPRLGTYYYALNMKDAALADARVRRALSMAIDREYIVEEITGAGQMPAYSFVPPGTGNYGEPALADYRELSMIDREEQAIELLTEAGYGPDNPLEVEIRYNTSENHKQVALAIADMWAPLGVEVKLFNSDVATHYAYLRDGGEFQVARAGWIADYNDAQNLLFLVESDSVGFNYAKYDNPEYDALMDKAATTIDLEDRAKILRQAEEHFMRDLPFIPIYHYVNLELVSSDVSGWEQNVQGVHLTKYVRLK